MSTAEAHPLRRRLARAVPALLAVAAAGLLLLCPLPGGWQGGWRGQLVDLAHVPLFAALTAALAYSWGDAWYRSTLPAVALAALAEVVQSAVGRSGNFVDFLHGAGGAVAMSLALRAWRRPASRARRVASGLGALAAVLVSALGAASPLLDAVQGALAFPTLADFRTERELARWHCQQSRLARAPDAGRPGAFVGRIEFGTGPDAYPGVQLEHVRRDFTGYRRLCWAFRVEGEPLTLVFSLRAGPDGLGRTSHYQFEQTFGPGEHRAEMDLAQAAAEARPAAMDRTDLWWSQVFTVRPTAHRVIHLRRVWLE